MERRISISARQVVAAMLLGIATYLEHSGDKDPRTRKYAPAYGLVAALAGLLRSLIGGERAGKGGSRPGPRLLIQIGALAASLFFAWAWRFIRKYRQ